MADDLIQIDEYIVTEQIVDFVLACVVARAQAPNSAHFVGGVMIDVHRWIFLPARVNPVDKSLEGGLFTIAIVPPPVGLNAIAFPLLRSVSRAPNRYSSPPATSG